jgi:succinoglycan biosynthesis transport protein ExoP
MVVGPLTSDLAPPLEDGLSARALLSSIRRHLAIVLGLAFTLCVVGILVGLGLPAWFKAEGVLVIHARPQRIAELQELPDPSPDTSYIQSEVDILSSASVVEPVVRSLKLWEAPEFQEMEYPKGWSWQTVKDRVNETWRGIWGPAENAPSEPAESVRSGDANTTPTQAQIDTAVRTYMGYLVVSNDGHSNTIRVSYLAWTPDRAAAVVNAHMESYRNLEVKAKMAAAEHANSALTSQVTELRQQLQTAEAAVTRYREEHHLTGAAKDSAGVSAQLAALNSQLMIARADLAENEARAARINAGGDSLPEVVASGTISALRGQEAQLVAREADLAKYHGDEYPELRRVRASLQTVRDQISRQIGRDRAAALQVAERSRTRERSLQQSITELTKQLNSADAGLQQLQGKADSIRSLLVNFEKRVGETAANPAFITPNSTVASRASESTASTSSKTKVLGAVGGFVGFTFGSLLAVLMELREKGFRTSMQVQQHTGTLTVCATPRALGRKRRSPADIILTDNRSAFAEAFRVSWANIHLAISDPRSASFGGRRQGTALGITSASSGEGKSTHALALARTAALAGEDVVLVDADLRRAGVSRLLKQEPRFTLRDFLQDRCSANDTIAVEGQSGVHFVASTPANVSWTKYELHRFFNLIDYLKGQFALVVIDFPPILGLADTLRLATAAESVALVIRWGRTERQFVQFALDALRSASVSTTAVILNDIDLKAQRRRGYRDHSVVYTDKGLYRAKPGYQRPAVTPTTSLPTAPAQSDPASDANEEAKTLRREAYHDRPRPAGSDIERLYNRYHD